jgi:hypothetical protein
MKKRLPRKEIAMKFKDGMSIGDLAVQYKDFFPRSFPHHSLNCAARENAIIEIIRQYMRRQDKG